MSSRSEAAVDRFYSPQLDGLRFIAALLVFIHHAPALPYLGALKSVGWLGVDLFLAISAFLITRLIILEHERTGAFSMRAFFIRRALRIWPLYLSYATVACLVSAVMGVVGFGSALGWWLSHLSFSNNVATAALGYSPVAFSAHLWTISLEEQAYFIIPFLLSASLAAGSPGRRPVQFCLAAIVVLVLARLALVVLGVKHPFIWVLPLRSDAFLLGSLAAIYSQRIKVPRWALVAAGTLLLCSTTLFPPIETSSAYQTFGFTILAVGCASLVLGAQTPSLYWVLGNAPVRYLGKISYGIYVFHLAGIYVGTKVAIRLGQGPLTALLLGLAATLLTAALSYRILETPFLKLKERFAKVQSRAV